jgi:gamma-glutamyltranspeptidase/glutathione hydrolase
MLAVTVPGIVAGWEAAVKRFGRMPLATLLAPAIETAEDGFPVSPYVSHAWSVGTQLLRKDPESAETWFLAGGRTPCTGEVFRNPDLARTLNAIAEGGAAAFYQGEIADRIARRSESSGGNLTRSDLANHTADWVEPISAEYRGYGILQMPPNGQGVAVLEAGKILERCDLAEMGHNTAATIHLQAEAIRLAMTDAKMHVTDPDHLRIDILQLLSEPHIAAQLARISGHREPDRVGTGPLADGDTVYVCAADKEGNVVSLINSIYKAWGTGITVPGTGVLLQNRASDFSLDPGHPNVLAPRKRTRHTTIPAMMFCGGEPLLAFGFVGGDMQPQGQIQFICNMVDFGMNVQDALDAPRWRYAGRKSSLTTENGVGADVCRALIALGHDVHCDDGLFGAGQAILIHPEHQTFQGGSDARRDGCAIGY